MTVCVPCASALVVNVARAVFDPVAVSVMPVALPITWPFTVNRIAPVGSSLFAPLTFAVNVTGPPSVAGEGDAASVTLDVFSRVPAGATSWTNIGEMLGGTAPLPRYRAVMPWAPPASVVVENRAVVPESGTVPSSVAPS